MNRKGAKRSAAFFLLLGAAGYLLYGLDRQMLFAYLPYGFALGLCLGVRLPLVPQGPWRLKSCALLALAAFLLPVLPRVRSSELKGFYVDAWSLKPGMTPADSLKQAKKALAADASGRPASRRLRPPPS